MTRKQVIIRWASVVWFVSLISWIGSASAADIYTSRYLESECIVVEGEIAGGDTERLKAIVEGMGPGTSPTVLLRSPGGDYLEAIRMGRLFRQLHLSANVPESKNGRAICGDDYDPRPRNPDNCTCASACSFAYVGASFRNGAYLAVHRPYFDPAKFSTLPADEAAARYRVLRTSADSYLEEMGVGREIYQLMMSAASNEVSLVSPDYIKKYLWGWIPEVDEWILARCPGAPPRDEMRRLSERFLQKSITADEKKRLDELFEASHRVAACRVATAQEIRRTAYDKVFSRSKSRMQR